MALNLEKEINKTAPTTKNNKTKVLSAAGHLALFIFIKWQKIEDIEQFVPLGSQITSGCADEKAELAVNRSYIVKGQ